MKKAIYKYPLELTGKQAIHIPAPMKILTVQIQKGIPCLWAEVDPDSPEQIRVKIRMNGTGHELHDEHAEYLATTQMGDYVWHWYRIHE